ncbi:hypothetical protein BCR44DRAFT_62137 [Catenaria anguillulae PL171]|uniref:Uncharacterized protein n=1 Tax=Catenaria anguillulae PL171 TaxID=765915 RepID=A0A1Y2HVQ2_9FUNG|nr:hypothetical protein BCR44DRAFT_62137 [Catenaria anguillulae PL171]
MDAANKSHDILPSSATTSPPPPRPHGAAFKTIPPVQKPKLPTFRNSHSPPNPKPPTAHAQPHPTQRPLSPLHAAHGRTDDRSNATWHKHHEPARP